ncbi:transposase [Kitasatospora sp. NPDC058063]|uniref:transposase n=1 Tax=unclassified Kitasatospora TaxID=2633591 RepID=UPI0036D8DAAA
MPLTDAQWTRIEPLLPDRTPGRGGRWRDHREVIDAIARKFRTGAQRVHLPERYGNWQGVCNRLRTDLDRLGGTGAGWVRPRRAAVGCGADGLIMCRRTGTARVRNSA